MGESGGLWGNLGDSGGIWGIVGDGKRYSHGFDRADNAENYPHGSTAHA